MTSKFKQDLRDGLTCIKAIEKYCIDQDTGHLGGEWVQMEINKRKKLGKTSLNVKKTHLYFCIFNIVIDQ